MTLVHADPDFQDLLVQTAAAHGIAVGLVEKDYWVTHAHCQHMLALPVMAGLSIRKIDDEVYQKLRARAAENGVSMEEEARRIIRQAVTAPHRLGDLAVQCFGQAHGVDLNPERRKPHEPLDLRE